MRWASGVSVCGEMAGDPAFTELLLAMGLRSFSMHPARIASVKQRVLRADTRQLAAHLAGVLEADNPGEALRLALQGARGACTDPCALRPPPVGPNVISSRCKVLAAG